MMFIIIYSTAKPADNVVWYVAYVIAEAMLWDCVHTGDVASNGDKVDGDFVARRSDVQHPACVQPRQRQYDRGRNTSSHSTSVHGTAESVVPAVDLEATSWMRRDQELSCCWGEDRRETTEQNFYIF